MSTRVLRVEMSHPLHEVWHPSLSTVWTAGRRTAVLTVGHARLHLLMVTLQYTLKVSTAGLPSTIIAYHGVSTSISVGPRVLTLDVCGTPGMHDGSSS